MNIVKRPRQSTWPVTFGWPDEHVDRMFRDMFRDFFGNGANMLERYVDANPMRLEEYIEDGTCVIRAELPGMDPEKDIEISMVDGYLRVAAHREERTEEDKPEGYRSEFRYGSYERTLPLPEGAKESDVTATYDNGVLEVRVPMGAVAKEPTRIPVTHA